MNIIFIRHGQGEHTLNFPKSLQIVDPPLTEKGIDQSIRLNDRFPITSDDMIIASPTRRTIETDLHWDHGRKSQLFIHNAVGPRMFSSRH
jgi:broad specificity phosphatase PhoE